MKLSRLRNRLARWLTAAPAISRATHTAYSEQFMDGGGEQFTGRIYDYATGKVLEEFAGKGDRKAAGRAAASRLKKYRKE